MFYCARRLLSGFGFGGLAGLASRKSAKRGRDWRSACFRGADALEQRVLLSGEHLVFTQQPVNTTAGQTITVEVTEEDDQGNVVNSTGDRIILTGSNNNIIAPLFVANLSNGVATFNNVTLFGAGNQTLSVQDFDTPAVTVGTSQSFNVAAASPATLAFVSQPKTVAGALAPVQVKVLDVYGNTVTTDTSTITLAVVAHPTGGALTGTTSLAVTGGVANFTTVGLSAMGNYTLQATDGNLTLATSNTVEIRPQVTVTGTFDSAQGKTPTGDIVIDSLGNIFGTASTGGANNDGTVYEIFKDSGVETTVATFAGTNGSAPKGGLVVDKKGNLYGTTSTGGANGDGTIFEIVKDSGTITTLLSFGGANGSTPVSGLTIDKAGNLYGTTSVGGANGDGEVFEFTTKHQLVLWTSFTGQNGSNPSADVTLDKSGNVYGTTSGVSGTSNGTVFKITKGKHVMTVLKSFNSTASTPMGAVVIDKTGNVFGTTGGFGRTDDGTIFEITKAGVYSSLASFDGTDGSSPESGLVLDSSGDIFGASNSGGEFDLGGIFELAKGSGIIQTLTSFNGTADGAFPQTTLHSDGHGHLIGVASEGGSGEWGTAFSFSMPVAVAPPAKLVFVKGADHIEVKVEDSHGAVITTGSFDLTLSLVSAPAGAVIGTLPDTITTVDGIATFGNVTLSSNVGKYVLSVSDWGVKSSKLTINVKSA